MAGLTRTLICCAALSTFVLAPHGVRAQEAAATPADRDAEARALYQAGRASYDAGRYQDALSYFQRSYELSGRPQLLYNIAQAADRQRMDVTTLAALRAYLKALPDAANRVEVQNRIRAIEAAMAVDDDAAAADGPAKADEPETGDDTQPATTAAPAAALAPDQAASGDADGGLLSKWWFWAGAGVLTAGAVGVAIAASGGDSEPRAPIGGSDGVVITTLEMR